MFVSRAALIVVLCAVLASLASPVAAQEQAPGLTLAARPGYAGAYRSGEWFPVVVDLANDGRDLRGVLEWSFPGQRNEPAFRREVDLPRGSRKRVTLEVFSRGFARNGLVRLVENGGALIEQSISLEPIDPDRFLIVVAGTDPALLTSLSAMQINGSSGAVVRHVTLDELPSQPLALRGVNALFVHDVDTSALAESQRSALRTWVGLGGQLIVGGGIGGERAAAGLADVLPVEPASTIASGDLAPLEQLGGSPPTPANGPLLNVRPRAGAEPLPADAPLIYRARYGAGAVIFSRFDLALLRGWGGEPALWAQVLQPIPQFVPGFGARVNQLSLLQDVLQLPALGLPSATALAAFLLAYILVIGPGNYLLLRRIGRLEWAWLTIPLTVVLFAAGLYLAGFGLRGGQSQLNQIAVVQGAEGETRGVVTAYLGMFSPLRSSYALRFPADSLVSETRGFDDLSARPLEPVSDDTGVAVSNVLIDVASVRMLLVETPLALPVQVQSALQNSAGGPLGEVRNTGATPIEQAIVIYNGAFQDLGTLAPGAGVTIDFSRAQRNFPYSVQVGDDRVFNRRQMLTRLFSSDSARFAPTPSTGSPLDAQGVYLIGWNSTPALAVDVDGRTASQQGLTLFVIRLRGA